LADNNFRKTIWFLWLQGLDSAPSIVKKCYESWVKYNPGWNVAFLDESNIADYTLLKPMPVTRQALSDIIRINLLAKHGGVWVDATCFCTTPLDNWLDKYMAQGFFAFEKPGDDRMLSSWFIASSENNYITLTYKNAVNAYWEKNPRIASFETSKWLFLFRNLQQRGTQVWFSTVVTKILKVYPYFWFHYLFENIYLKDKVVREMWHLTLK
jgi:mannosyltransferase OCH1-like enzyme